MGGGVRLLCAVLWVILGGMSLGSNAKTLYVLDFDGSINNDHSPQPAWKTRWILYRVRHLRSLLQTSPDELGLPETIDISYGEYIRLRPLLAKGEGVIGDLKPRELDADPLWTDRPTTIVPGYYYVDPDHSFKYYRPGLRNKNYILRDYQDAKRRHEISAESDGWQGLAFPLLRKALSSEASVHDLAILTARHHTTREYMQLLEAMKKDGFVKYVTGKSRSGRKTMPRFYSLQAPDALAFGRHGISERKASAVVELARELLEANDGQEHLELASDQDQASQGVRRKMHTLIVSEDSPQNVESIRKALEMLSTELGFHARVKFVLFNTAPEDVVAQARWPYRWTVFSGGFGREALPTEIADWSKDASCEGVLQ